MDKFNLHEWIGKGEKNLLNEARDEDDFMTTISPEEQGVDPADATRESSLEEDSLEELKMDGPKLTQLLDQLARTREFKKMVDSIAGDEKELASLVKQAKEGVTKPLIDLLRMSKIHVTDEFDLLKASLNGGTIAVMLKIIDYLTKENRTNRRGIGPDNFGEDSLEEEQLNESPLTPLKSALAAVVALLGSKRMKQAIMSARYGEYGEEGEAVAKMATQIYKMLGGKGGL